MPHDTDNPFAPPGAVLTGDEAEDAAVGSERAAPLLRVMATVLGFALPFALLLGSPLVFEVLGRFARLQALDGFLARMLPLLCFLSVYLPWAALELHRRSQTLPFRVFGLRFRAADGSRPTWLRIAVLYCLPRVLLGWGPFITAITLNLGSNLGPGLSVSGPVFLLLDAATAWREGRRTWLDRFAGLVVVRA